MDLPIYKNICCHVITYYKNEGHRALRHPSQTFIMRLASTPKSQAKDTQNPIGKLYFLLYNFR